MIVKETKKAGSAASSLSYIMGGEKDDPQHVRIVATSEVMIPLSAQKMIESVETTAAGKKSHKKEIRAIAKKLAVPFDLRGQMAGSRVSMPNESYIVSFAPEDRVALNPEMENNILLELLRMIGVHGDIRVRRRRHKKTYFETKRRTAMFIAVGHTETNCYHWHVFTSRIDSEGRANETSFEHRRIVKACQVLSNKYGIRMEPMPDTEVTPDKVNKGYYTKVQMTKTIEEAKQHACSWLEFEETIRTKGILYSIGDRGIVFEYMKGAGKNGELKSHIYSGTQLSRELTFPKIKRAIKQNAERAEKKRQAEERQKAERERKIQAKKNNEKRIVDFINSEKGQLLLDYINNSFDYGSHDHLVSGPIIVSENSLRWVLYSDGYTDGNEIHQPHPKRPQAYGKSYVDFCFNENGELMASIEADNTNYYSKGVSGVVNIVTGEGDVRIRNYVGALEAKEARRANAPKNKSTVSQTKKKYTKHM